ncbi:Ferredoxin--NADP reductase [Candidatus Providencia siddallii]|uniref:Flavodoxin/ferredoxin--NADP reductase n=1 Tax=Candidatus Providencia siddallii TaxID=1715285 RepID=A0A0M6W783_9GAMM|nr:Ferredoxin--NADP reductase [Candidatus Providencia siddallii]
MSKWVTGKIIKNKFWTNSLFSLIIKAPIKTFIAGQYAKLSLKINGERIQRAYSYVNPPSSNNLEFYFVIIPNGKLSSNLAKLQYGDRLQITYEANGSFILKEIPKCQNLWMLSTGTAIGPFLSILQDGNDLVRFKNIILLHAVRHQKDLVFLPLMNKLKQNLEGKLHIVTVVSREVCKNSLHGRIPSLIKNSELENTVGIQLSSKTCHVMLCGNPEMVKNTRELLENNYNMKKHFRGNQGNISNEQYW